MSQIHGVAPRTEIHYSVLSMGGSIEIFRQLEQVFGPYRMMFKELKEKR
jgi:hypothetical protein